MDFRFLLSGIDTLECAYWLARTGNTSLDFRQLEVEKSAMVQSKSRRPKAMQLGSEELLLEPRGTGSGYSFLLQNEAFSIQCGEFNKPNFYVTFRSFALWHSGADQLHARFLTWAKSIGMTPYRSESLSRVDFAFDYQMSIIDFDEDSFVSLASKDAQHRKDGRLQTFRLGSGDLVLRVYHKSDEIEEKSEKVWFHPMWGVEQDVWRIEWQARKELLKRFGIRTFESLRERQGDLLRHLVNDHTTLRVPGNDSNRSRWPVHPLWQDLQQRALQMDGLGVVRECDRQALLDERVLRVGISVYGYMKQLAALHGAQRGYTEVGLQETSDKLLKLFDRLHDPLAWECGVRRRMDDIRMGQW